MAALAGIVLLAFRAVNRSKYKIQSERGIDEDSDLYGLIHSEMYNGDLGENYSILMTLFPPTTRQKVVPCDWYDGMIYLYRATPLDLI